MGFMKSFGFADLSELTLEIPRLTGTLWLISAFLFLAVIILFALRKKWWWVPTIFAAVLSQLLIFFAWQDAKFGTVANIIILIAIVIRSSKWADGKRVYN
jgi:hypothetical protein